MNNVYRSPYDPYNLPGGGKKKGGGGGGGGKQHHGGGGTPGGGGHQGGGGKPQSERTGRSDVAPITLFDENDQIRCDLLTKEAEEWAMQFTTGIKGDLTKHQIRKFFNEVKSLSEMERVRGWDATKPFFRLLKSKVAYACPHTGKNQRVPESFRQFIEKIVNSAETEKDFHATVTFFEAVLGYYYGEVGR